MFKSMLLAYFLFIPSIFAPILIQEELKDHENLAKAIIYVTDNYVSSLTSTVIVMQMCKYCTSLQQNFHHRLLNYVLLSCNSELSWILLADSRNDQPWNFNIFIVDSAEAFDDLIKQIILNVYETEYYILVVYTHTKDMQREELKPHLVKIVESGLLLNIINIVIMVENSHGRVIYYRSRAHGRDCGYNINIERFNYFYKGKAKRQFLFPYRLRNFNNCTMRVLAFEMPPFFIFNGDKNNETQLGESSHLAGIDGFLLKILEQSLNFSLKLSFAKGKNEIFDNGTATGYWAMLQNDSVDVVVSNFGLQTQSRIFFSASYVYHQTPFVAVVRSSMQYSSLKQMLCPFKNQIWDLLIWFFVIKLAFIGLLRKFESIDLFAFLTDGISKRPTIFNLLVTLIGMPVKHLPERCSTRLLIICWIFLTFVLRNIYQGKMFDSLRVSQRVHPPRSLDDLIVQNFLMISREYLEFYPRNLTYIVNGTYPARFAMLENAEDSMRIASYSLLDYLAHHNHMNWNTSRLTIVNDPLKLFQLVMYFKKHSRFKFAFDAKLKQLLNAGIVSHITKRYVKREFRLMNQLPQEVTQISFSMLFGLYAIYSALVGWSILIFILEVLSRKCRLLRWVFDILRLFE